MYYYFRIYWFSGRISTYKLPASAISSNNLNIEMNEKYLKELVKNAKVMLFSVFCPKAGSLCLVYSRCESYLLNTNKVRARLYGGAPDSL